MIDVGIHFARGRVRAAASVALVAAGCGDAVVAARSDVVPASTPAVAAAPGAKVVPPGHKRMLAALREIRDQSDENNPFLGGARSRMFAKQLAEMTPATPDLERWWAEAGLADALVLLGKEREGIAHFQTARDLLPKVSKLLGPDDEKEFLVRFGTAWMRLGETENCCSRNSPGSCILPISGDALHSKPEGSRTAMDLFAQVIDSAPVDSKVSLQARWLLSIAAMTLGEYPDGVPKNHRDPPSYFAADEEFPHFENIAKSLGLAAFNLSGGVIADDFDNDGWIDLVVSTSDEAGQIRFFRNNGDGTFTDRTQAANLNGIFGGLNILQADYDNDGFVDVLVLRQAWIGPAGCQPNSLLHNDGDGTFTDVTYSAGLAKVDYPTQTAAWADYDGDGLLDLFVGNELEHLNVHAPCQLFHNEGNGKFVDRAEAAGTTNDRFTKGVVAGDYDGDGFPDYYVSNMSAQNWLYHNKRDGTFEDVALKLGVERPTESFGAMFWDFDNDGALDMLAIAFPAPIWDQAAAAMNLPFKTELPCLYRGDGKGGFAEVGRAANLVKPCSPMGHNCGDLDNDGYLDLYLATGSPYAREIMPNLLYRNRAGKSFADVTLASGMGNLQKGHGVAFADFDGDGDLDVFSQMGGAYQGDRFYDCLYENPGFGNHWLAVRLEGRRSNRSAIGARIRAEIVEDGKRRSVYRTVGSGGSFGANPLRQHLGLGKATKIETLEILWPTTGKTQSFHDVRADQIVEIVEGEDRLNVRGQKAAKFGGGK